MKEKYRPHPLEIFNNMWQVMYLLIIPALRGILLALQGDFTIWIAGTWKDILILGLIGLIAVLKWYNCTISIKEKALYVNSGLFYKREKIIPLNNLCTISKSENVFYKPFKAIGVT
ncbi:MAG: PH domain-containing protein, partial [Oscillospiraceae bacterium]